MTSAIGSCLICNKAVSLEKAITESNGKAVHPECLDAAIIDKFPEQLAISPMALLCPRCHAEPGNICEVFGGDLEIVHIERIKAAAILDEAAGNRTHSGPSE